MQRPVVGKDVPTPAEIKRQFERTDILFLMAHAGFYRNFQSVIRLLRDAGLTVHVRFSKRHDLISLDDYEDLRSPGPGITTSIAEDVDPRTSPTKQRLRVVRDMIFYNQPEFREATNLRRRFPQMQKDFFSPTVFRGAQRLLEYLPPTLISRLDGLLSWWDLKVADVRIAAGLLRQHQPRLLIVTPLVNFASREVDAVIAARRLGVPSMLAVASWDNLTNKGRMKAIPDSVVVWNRYMAEEAVALHNVPSEKIIITGAPLFDHWFERQPSRERAAFCESLGFDAGQSIIVYFGSSLSIAGDNEVSVIGHWLEHIRASQDPRVRNANVLVRPHPMASQGWDRRIAERPEREQRLWRSVAIWPKKPTHPTSEQSRADFFDTLYFADAAVGLNTSVMIEAAILRKPVLTFFDKLVGDGQSGNLHFKHLTAGKAIMQAGSLEEHCTHLSLALANPKASSECADRFVLEFVRPAGRDHAASRLLAERIKEALHEESRPTEA